MPPLPRRALAGERPLGALRQGAAAHQGPQRARLLLRADARGGGHRPRAPRGALLSRPAAQSVPDPDQVPRRDPPALRPHARARVHHEGRLLLSRRRTTTAEREYDSMSRRLSAHLRALRAEASGRSKPTPAPSAAAMSHEFQVLAESGEDAIVSCTACDYAANVEKAEIKRARRRARYRRSVRRRSRKCRHARRSAPSRRSRRFSPCRPTASSRRCFHRPKTGRPVAALVRGDHELSELKLRTALGCAVAGLGRCSRPCERTPARRSASPGRSA